MTPAYPLQSAESDSSTSVAPSADDLIRDHLPLVHRAVAEMASRTPRHVSRDDLRSAGMLGLIQAARSFDGSRGVPFARYAGTRIRGALIDELRSLDWASRPVRARARTLETTRERLTADLQRAPSNDELAGALGVGRTVVENLTGDLHRATVLNFESMPGAADGEMPLAGGLTNPEAELLDREMLAYLVDAVQALPERLRRVVIGYFFQHRSMQELGDELGVSESRISQIRAEALELLKDGINSQLEPEAVRAPNRPNGRIARRKAAYYDQIAASSTSRDRLDSRPRAAHRARSAADAAVVASIAG